MQTIESLENRLLFSGEPSFHVTSNGTLIIQGTVDANEIEVFLVHGSASQGVGAIVGVPDHGLQRLSNVYRAAPGAVKRIWIDAGGGNDSINISQVTRPATVLGGAGDDAISEDAAGPMVAYGGAGNDSLGPNANLICYDRQLTNKTIIDQFVAQTNDTAINQFVGGKGDDTLSGDANDRLDGGAGNDHGTLSFSATQKFSLDRVNMLAADYYQRLGAASIEQIEGNIASDIAVTYNT